MKDYGWTTDDGRQMMAIAHKFRPFRSSELKENCKERIVKLVKN